MSDKVSVFFMADYAECYGKGFEVESITNGLIVNDLLDNVIVRDFKDKNNVYLKRSIIGGAFFYKILTAIEKKIFPFFQSRYWQERLFDYSSSRIVKKLDSKYIYVVPRMPKTVANAKKAGKTVILHAAEMHPQENFIILNKVYKSKKQYPPIWSERSLRLSEQTLGNIDHIICHSDSSLLSYKKHGFKDRKLSVTPMGFDPMSCTIKKNYSSDSITRYMFAGNITKMKGIDILLESWDFISDSTCELYLCGNIQSDMKELIETYKKKYKNIFTPGHVSLNEYFEKCDVFVFPSRSEGCSRAVIEAAASGLVIISSFVATDSNLFKLNNGFLIELDVEKFSETMNLVKGDFEKIKLIGSRSASTCSDLSWSNFGLITADLIKKIIKSGC